MPVGSHVSFCNFQNRTCWGHQSDEKDTLCECVTDVSGVERGSWGGGLRWKRARKNTGIRPYIRQL